jgi:hypothetical protein
VGKEKKESWASKGELKRKGLGFLKYFSNSNYKLI